MKYTKFEELPMWKESIKVAKEIYRYSSNSRWSKDFALRDQIRRAVISISSNIVEGFEKNNNNEFARYLSIAKGSIGEVRNQLYLASELNYIESTEFAILNGKLVELSSQLGGLMAYLKEHKKLKIRNS